MKSEISQVRNFASRAIFSENWRIKTGSDGENFCFFDVIILTASKNLVVMRFYRFVKR